MRYWWVNQNQTYKHEVSGGYLWSPKRKKNGHRNRFYENMREVSPGDIIFSFRDTRIPALGVATSYAETSPRPGEFGTVGDQWHTEGWKVGVRYYPLSHKIRPVDHIEDLRGLLPNRHSPLQSDGSGNQGVYLAEIPESLAVRLLQLIGPDAAAAVGDAPSMAEHPIDQPETDEAIEAQEEQEVANITATVPSQTEREALLKSRVGQGQFRKAVAVIEPRCRVTGVTNMAHLTASHIKPWRVCSNAERLDGNNGLLLAPHIDHLFDKGFISFHDTGDLLISPVADTVSLQRMGINTERITNVGAFSPHQSVFLAYHRDSVFKAAIRKS